MKRGIEGTIVGRQTEVDRLAAALDAVEAGERRVLIIEGEAGIGKSRLVGELARLVRERGHTYLLGAGQSTEQQTPYRAWRDIFTSYFDLDETAGINARRKRVQKVVQDYVARTKHPMSHIRDLFDCVKSRRPTIANPEVMHRSMTTVHAANICMWLKRDMKYDPVKEEFIGDDEANRLRTRAQREPWIM